MAKVWFGLSDLFEIWQDAVDPTASMSQLAAHPAKDEILSRLRDNGNGPGYLIGMLHNYSRYGVLAMVVLSELAGTDPVRKNHHCDAHMMLSDWLDWAHKRQIEPVLEDV